MNLVILGGASFNTPAFFATLSRNDTWLDRVCLVGRSAEGVERVGKYCQAIAQKLDLPVQITWDTNLARAAVGAEVVLNMLRVGGMAAVRMDSRRLAASGVVGHAATYPQAIRNLPASLEAAQVVERVAPNALWLNFSNPVTILSEALALYTKLRCIGICYHAFTMRRDFASILGADPANVRVEYFGLNHLGWVTNVSVDGASRMTQLVEELQRRRNKKYNYWYADPRMIPVDHAVCLYHKGDVWFNRQKGIRGSLVDIGVRLGLPEPEVSRESRRRQVLQQAVSDFNLNSLDEFSLQAPWYSTCIVPFLGALASNQAHEFILTWNHAGAAWNLPNCTIESNVMIQGDQVHPISPAVELAEFAVEWVRQARASERLFLCAIIEQSFDLAAQAWAIHPNVASLKHAERLASFYFEKRG